MVPLLIPLRFVSRYFQEEALEEGHPDAYETPDEKV